MNGDLFPGGIQRNDDSFAREFPGELTEQADIYLAVVKSSAPDNDLGSAPSGNFLGARNSANSPAHANLHPEISACSRAQLSNEVIVCSLSHRGVEVDDVQPGIGFEFFQQAKNIRDGKFALFSVDQLDGLPALQIDARNQHGSRTWTPCAARNSLRARIG